MVWSTPYSLETKCWHLGNQIWGGMAQELSSRALRQGTPYEVRKILRYCPYLACLAREHRRDCWDKLHCDAIDRELSERTLQFSIA